VFDGQDRPDPRARSAQPIEGLTEWDNPGNRVHVVELHYTADPAKRSDAWKAETFRGLDRRAVAREYDLCWEIPEGQPVFPEYDHGRMCRSLTFIPGARLLRFWDFGHVCPVTLFAQVDLWGRLLLLSELVLTNQSLAEQIIATKARTLQITGMPDYPVLDAGDPAAEKEMDLGSVRASLMRQNILLRCLPSNQGSYENLRMRLLRHVLVEKEGPSPAFLIDPSCKFLGEALKGAFHRHPKTEKVVDKHPYKDVCDALRYGNDNLLGLQSDWMKKMREAAHRDEAW
jgi:hypothetical protein